MFKYAVVEIAGRQYKVVPNQELVVNKLDQEGFFECDKVLLKADGDKLSVGMPYLKDKIKFEVVEQVRGKKIRVSIFHAKANYRRTTGSRSQNTKIRVVSA